MRHEKPFFVSLFLVSKSSRFSFTLQVARRHIINSMSNICFMPGGYSWEFLVEVCRLVLQILTPFQAKNYHFPLSFSDLASKIHTRFQT